MLISTPLRNVSIIAPPTPVIVPNTLALPDALWKFNFSKLRKFNNNNKLIYLSYVVRTLDSLIC